MTWARTVLVVALLGLAACGGDRERSTGDADGVGTGDAAPTTATTATATTAAGTTNAPLDDLPPLLEPVGGVSLSGFAASGMLIDRLHIPAGGVDLTPFFPDGWCPVPHWGAVLEGAVHVRYADGAEEVYRAKSAYFMRPDHTVSFDEETTLLEVSPEGDMRDLIAHVDSTVTEMLATTTTTNP